MEKVIRDGKVAVLVSPGYGAGWSTWNPNFPQCKFDPEIVEWVEGGGKAPMPDMKKKYGDRFYDGGAEQLKVVWVPEGRCFRIKENDGYESLVFREEDSYDTA